MSRRAQRDWTKAWSASDSSAAEAVVDVDGGEADAERVLRQRVGGVEEQQEGCRVRAAGDGDADAVAGAQRSWGKGEHGPIAIVPFEAQANRQENDAPSKPVRLRWMGHNRLRRLQ